MAKKRRKKKDIRGIPDEFAFKLLKHTQSMKIKKEHSAMLGKFIIEQGYKIAKGKGDKTFDEVFNMLKESLIQVKKLKESYDK